MYVELHMENQLAWWFIWDLECQFWCWCDVWGLGCRIDCQYCLYWCSTNDIPIYVHEFKYLGTISANIQIRYLSRKPRYLFFRKIYFNFLLNFIPMSSWKCCMHNILLPYKQIMSKCEGKSEIDWLEKIFSSIIPIYYLIPLICLLYFIPAKLKWLNQNREK